MPSAAFNTGPEFHLLDHIAPLAEILNIPLFIELEKNFRMAQRYYPTVEARYLPDIESQLGVLAEHFDTFYGCKSWAPHLKQLLYDLHQRQIKLIYCAHGQSDKGYSSPLLHHYSYHDCTLIYGNLLKDMLSELGIASSFIRTGNYRLSYYQKNKTFYDDLIEKEVFSYLPKNRKTILYAPTWDDSDSATTFFEQTPLLLESIPEEYNLIVKVHPLLEEKNPAQYYRVAAMLDRKPNHHLVSESPLIYPLLARSNIYIGDYSSVGYDFLYFRRPMYFLLHDRLPTGRLHQCGTILKTPQSIKKELTKEHPFRAKQKKLYEYAFDHSPLGGKTKSVCNSLRSSTFEHTSISYA